MNTSFVARNCLLLLLSWSLLSALPDDHGSRVAAERRITASLKLANTLACFIPVERTSAYSITLCADVPDDNHPEKVYVHREPGHVFLMLEKRDSLLEIIQDIALLNHLSVTTLNGKYIIKKGKP